MRYTKTVAREELVGINAALRAVNHPTFLRISGRNGYQGLDLFERNTGTCLRTIATGTPRECIAAAHQYSFDALFLYSQQKGN